MMGWAVNSIAKAVEGSIPFLPINCKVVAHDPLAKRKQSTVFCLAQESVWCERKKKKLIKAFIAQR
jgi:hypothetical protein